MTVRKETIEEVVERTRTIVECDICHEEVSVLEIDIDSNSFENVSRRINGNFKPSFWFKHPLKAIVGIAKGSNRDEDNADFNVHVGCAYEAIKNAVESRGGNNQ